MRIHDILRPLGLLLLSVELHTITASPALAGTSAPGVNLRWDACYADGGAWNKNFACDTNVGTERLVVSFELAAPMDSVSGIETFLKLAAASPVLPAWWQFKNLGSCRTTALSYSSLPPAGSTGCLDWGMGQSAGGIGGYTIGSGLLGSPEVNEVQMSISTGVPPSARAQLNAGQEYFAFSLEMSHAKTVGAGACGGCQTPIVIYVASMSLLTTRASEDRFIGQGANYEGSAYASWQNGYPVNVVHFCERRDFFFDQCGRYGVNFDCVAASPTGTRGNSWGAIKSLYR